MMFVVIFGKHKVDKIETLFTRNPNDMSRVLPEINPVLLEQYPDLEKDWDSLLPTVKKDGTNIKIERNVWFDGPVAYKNLLYSRVNPTRGEKEAADARGERRPDPGYALSDPDDPKDKHIWRAYYSTPTVHWEEGTYFCEALGPKIQGGKEGGIPELYVFSHWPEVIPDGPVAPGFDVIEECLRNHYIEGIVWHTPDGKPVAKIKRKDFGLSW